MENMKRERLTEILLNPQDFIFYTDVDGWVIFKKKEDVKNLTTEEILGLECYYLNDPIDFAEEILTELKVELLKLE